MITLVRGKFFGGVPKCLLRGAIETAMNYRRSFSETTLSSFMVGSKRELLTHRINKN